MREDPSAPRASDRQTEWNRALSVFGELARTRWCAPPGPVKYPTLRIAMAAWSAAIAVLHYDEPLDHRNVAKRFGAAKSRRRWVRRASRVSALMTFAIPTPQPTSRRASMWFYLSRQLGHANSSITMDVYADLFEAREKADTSCKALEKSGYAGLV